MIIDFLAGYARICSPVFLCPAVSIKKNSGLFFLKQSAVFFYFSYISFNISLMIVVIRGSAAAAAF